MDTLDKDPPNDLVKEKNDLNDHDQELITASEWAKDQKSLISHNQAELIRKDLILVGDKELTDVERTDAAFRLANEYFEKPIYIKAWRANERRIITALKDMEILNNAARGWVWNKKYNRYNTGKQKPTGQPINIREIFRERVVVNLFIAVQKVEKKHEANFSFLEPSNAIKETGKQLNELMLCDFLGDTWRKKAVRFETKLENSLAHGYAENTKRVNEVVEGFTTGNPEQREERQKRDRTISNIHANTDDGISGIDGYGSSDWADWIKSFDGKGVTPPSVFTYQEMRIDVDRVLNQAGLTQKELTAINVGLNGMTIADYAWKQGMKANNLYAAEKRAVQKLRKALKTK